MLIGFACFYYKKNRTAAIENLSVVEKLYGENSGRILRLFGPLVGITETLYEPGNDHRSHLFSMVVFIIAIFRFTVKLDNRQLFSDEVFYKSADSIIRLRFRSG